ncbi:alpha/beta-hydrolase, partial [Stereum hirsutum FP-91666 SS1]|uniref:alpha/beta-hydrolase n=1 Tax=Stereum hirsutum (strain FP-91666) TaxID=721885 RepID=UPI000440F39E
LDPEDTYRMKDYNIPSSHSGEVRVRTLVPTAFDSDKEHKYPLLIFMHGGGMAAGSIRMEDYRMRNLCVRLNMSVVNVDYRLAPEYPFPTAINDCYSALKWVRRPFLSSSEPMHNADLLSASIQNVVVGGTSSGANLAAVLAQRASQDEFFALHNARLKGQILCMPMLCHPDAYPHEFKPYLRSFRSPKFVNGDGMITEESQRRSYRPIANPEISPLLFADRKSLPPLVAMVSGVDPTCDEGLLHERLVREAGVRTKLYTYPGAPHVHYYCWPTLKASMQALEDTHAGIQWLL